MTRTSGHGSPPGRGPATPLAAVAPSASVVLPSAPTETLALLDTRDPVLAGARVRELGAGAAVVTCGADGAVLDAGGGARRIPAVAVREVVDQTGAGDALTGTLAAGLARGDSLEVAAVAGVRAAAARLTGLGGTSSPSAFGSR